VLQPFYDVLKLFQKESIEVNTMHRFFVYISLIFVIFTTVIMLLGGDILLALFALTLGSIFFVLGGYASNSPYSTIGSERELLQMMPLSLCFCLQPLDCITGQELFYKRYSYGPHSFNCLSSGSFLGLLYVLTFKLRKSHLI